MAEKKHRQKKSVPVRSPWNVNKAVIDRRLRPRCCPCVNSSLLRAIFHSSVQGWMCGVENGIFFDFFSKLWNIIAHYR